MEVLTREYPREMMITREESQNPIEDELNDVPLAQIDEQIEVCEGVGHRLNEEIESLDRTEESLISAETYLEALDAIQANGGLDSNSAYVYNLAIENLQEKLGDNDESLYLSLENFNGSQDRVYQTSLALEGLSSKLGKWIEVFWQWIIDLVTSIAAALDNLKFINSRLVSKFNSLKSEVEKLPDSPQFARVAAPNCAYDCLVSSVGRWFNPCYSVTHSILNLEKFFLSVMDYDGTRQYRMNEKYLDLTCDAARQLAAKLKANNGATGGYKDIQDNYRTLDNGQKTWYREYKLKCDAIVTEMWEPYKTNTLFSNILGRYRKVNTLKGNTRTPDETSIGKALKDYFSIFQMSSNLTRAYITQQIAMLLTGTAHSYIVFYLLHGAVGWGLDKLGINKPIEMRPLVDAGILAPSIFNVSSNYDIAIYPANFQDIMPRDAKFIACHVDFGKFSKGTNVSDELFEVQRLERRFMVITDLLKDPIESLLTRLTYEKLKGVAYMPFCASNANVLANLKTCISSCLKILGARMSTAITELNKSAITSRKKLQAFKTSIGDTAANDRDYRLLARDTKNSISKLYAPMRAALVYLMKSYRMAYEACAKCFEDLKKLSKT